MPPGLFRRDLEEADHGPRAWLGTRRGPSGPENVNFAASLSAKSARMIEARIIRAPGVTCAKRRRSARRWKCLELRPAWTAPGFEPAPAGGCRADAGVWPGKDLTDFNIWVKEAIKSLASEGRGLL